MTGTPAKCDRKPLAVRWGTAVAERRHRLGITQAALAEMCGVGQQTISKIEKGLAIPRDPLKQLIAEKLGTKPWLLFSWPDEPKRAVPA